MNLKIYVLLIVFFCGCAAEEEPLPVDPKTYEGDVTLLSQIQVDNFGEQGYKRITGQLVLGFLDKGRSDITDLTPLAELQEVGDFLVRNTPLVSFKGLENLRKAKTLRIYGNLNLLSLDGLGSLDLADRLEMYYNNSIRDLNGLKPLGDSLTIIISEPLQGLSAMQEITYAKRIVFYDIQVEDLTDLRSLEIVEEDFRLWDANVRNLDGLGNLKKLNYLELYSNHALQSLSGLEGLREFDRMWITENPNLNNFCALRTDAILSSSSFLANFNGIKLLARDLIEGKCQ